MKLSGLMIPTDRRNLLLRVGNWKCQVRDVSGMGVAEVVRSGRRLSARVDPG